jgi:hypothetical protein
LLFLSFSPLQWLLLLARVQKKLPPKPLKALKPLLTQPLKVQKLLATLPLLLVTPLPKLARTPWVMPLPLLATLLKLARKLLPLLATLLPRLATLPRLLATLQKKLPSNSFLAFS